MSTANVGMPRAQARTTETQILTLDEWFREAGKVSVRPMRIIQDDVIATNPTMHATIVVELQSGQRKLPGFFDFPAQALIAPHTTMTLALGTDPAHPGMMRAVDLTFSQPVVITNPVSAFVFGNVFGRALDCFAKLYIQGVHVNAQGEATLDAQVGQGPFTMAASLVMGRNDLPGFGMSLHTWASGSPITRRAKHMPKMTPQAPFELAAKLVERVSYSLALDCNLPTLPPEQYWLRSELGTLVRVEGHAGVHTSGTVSQLTYQNEALHGVVNGDFAPLPAPMQSPAGTVLGGYRADFRVTPTNAKLALQLNGLEVRDSEYSIALDAGAPGGPTATRILSNAAGRPAMKIDGTCTVAITTPPANTEYVVSGGDGIISLPGVTVSQVAMSLETLTKMVKPGDTGAPRELAFAGRLMGNQVEIDEQELRVSRDAPTK